MAAPDERTRDDLGATAPRRILRDRARLVLFGLGLLALCALAAVLVGQHSAEPAPSRDADVVAASVTGEPDQSLPVVRALRQQPSARTRTVGIVVVAAVALTLATATRRVRRPSPDALRTLELRGRPPGRGPPRTRLA